MKKTLLALLLSALSLCSHAQLHKVAKFDFTQPLALNPPVTPSDIGTGEVQVTDKVFVEYPISISFTPGSQNLGAAIFTFKNIYTDAISYYLRILTYATISFNSSDNATIESIRFSNNSVIGDLSLLDETQGTFNDGDHYWYDGKNKGYNKVTFFNNYAPSEIRQVEVHYTIPSDVLQPTTDIADGSIVESFDKLALTFSSAMKIQNAANISMTNGTDTYKLTATVNGGVVTLSAPQTITKDGTYTITVPAKSFVNSEGFENKQLTYTIVIRKSFNYTSVTPEQGYLTALPMSITLAYDELVGGFDDANAIRLYKDGVAYLPVKATKDGDKQVKLEIQNITAPIKEKGVYKILVPEKTIFNSMKGDKELERYNNEFELVYTVDDSETTRLAKKLLKNDGVGYPSHESDAYKALADLINGETTPTDEQIQTAIDAYYAETNVVMPQSTKWYKLSSVNNAGKKLYINVDNGTLTFTDNAKNATPLLATVEAGTTILTDAEGNYISVGGVATDEDHKLADLAIARINPSTLKVDAGKPATAENTLCLFTLYGKIGFNALGESSSVYALVDHANKKFASDVTITDTYFKSSLTSAFSFEETEKPAEVIKTVNTAYQLTPAIVATNADLLTLTFTEVTGVSVATGTDAYFVDSNNKRVANAAFVAVNGKTNAFTISLKGILSKGDYSLVIPEGAFRYSKDGKTVKTQAINASFTIGRNGSADDPNISYTFTNYRILPVTSSDDYVKDVELNNIMIKSVGYYNNELVANPDREVTICLYNDARKVIGKGHFENYSDPDDSQTPTIRLKLNEPIKEGSVKSEVYALQIKQGTFGNNNFGKYLNDKTSVSVSSCIANPEMVLPLFVDNNKAIKSVETAYTLTPDVAESAADVLTLTFPDVKEMKLAANAKASFMEVKGSKIISATIVAAKDKKNVFTIALKGLEEKEYTLDISDGAFLYTKDGRDVKTTAISAAFSIGKNGSADDERISFTEKNFTVAPASSATDFIKDVELNSITLTAAEGTKLAVNKARKATLYSPKNEVVATGVFENVDKAAGSAIRFVMDKQIEAGKLAAGTYSLKIQKGTFGNENFLKFLADKTTVKAEDCVANPDTTLVFYVDNVKAIKTTETKFELLPAVAGQKDNTLTLSFPEVETLSLVADAKAQFTAADGTKAADAKLVADAEKKNVFSVSIEGLADGAYTLAISEGAFHYTLNDREVKTQAINAAFTVDKAVKVTETKFELLPAVAGQKDNTLTLSFPEVETLSLVADAKAQFTAADGTKAGDAKLVADAEKKNVFSVSIEGLADGAYTLAITEGAFHYTLNDREVKTQAINAAFTVDKAVKVTETKFELLPAVAGQKDNTLTLSFPEVETLSLVADAKAQFTAADGTKAADAKLVADAEKKNVFSVSIEGLADGAYTLAISEGAFHYTLNDREVKTQAINAQFTVDKAVKTVETKYELTPEVAESTDDHLTLTFPEVDALTVADGVTAQFNDAEGNKVADATFAADGEKKNQFTIALSQLDTEDYTLVIPEGAFIYTKDEIKVKTQAISYSFTIGKNGSADDERISFNYAGYTVKPESSTKEYLHDEELNNITVVAANDMTIAANTEREATLVSVVDQTNVVAKGHFEAVETAEGENATLRLVLDTPIVKGSLDAGVYMLQIAQGTFGNEEFGKFLADKKSVKAEDCVANAKTSILFYVDNTWTSINGIHADGTADGDIYTLQGVKVQKMTTPGVYIVNGKKIVKK